MDDSGTDNVECCKKVSSWRKVADAIRSMVDVRGLQLQCARVLHKALLIPVFMYGSDKVIWKEESSRIRAV